MSELGIDVSAAEGVTRVRVTGEIDLATAPQLRKCVIALTGVVVVDVAGVTFLDSSGLNAFIGARKSLEEHGGELRLRGMQPQVRRVFEVMGLDDWFDLE